MSSAGNGRIRIEARTVEANGQRLHYLVAGDGPLLPLLHGWPQHSHQWRAIMPALAEHFMVVAPDLRGAGGSSKPRAGCSKRELAADLRAPVRQQFGNQSTNLCGYDWGANVAYAYAALWPGKVERFALLEMAFSGFRYEEAMRPKPGWQPGWQLAAFTAPDICERFFVGRERDPLAWYFWRGSDNPSAVSMDDFEVYIRTQFTDNVRGAVLTNAGHWLSDDRPEELTRTLLEFINGSRS
jgi:pimeloyl-ACP methyl ester carboxylesterase